MDFRELFKSVHQRRRMYLLDDRYMTLVGFVTGCDAATEWRLLNGFDSWIEDHLAVGRSGLHWSTIVAGKRAPALLDESRTGTEMSPEQERAASDDLFEMLDRFLSRPAS
jgi:hypothetical protein